MDIPSPREQPTLPALISVHAVDLFRQVPTHKRHTYLSEYLTHKCSGCSKFNSHEEASVGMRLQSHPDPSSGMSPWPSTGITIWGRSPNCGIESRVGVGRAGRRNWKVRAGSGLTSWDLGPGPMQPCLYCHLNKNGDVLIAITLF